MVISRDQQADEQEPGARVSRPDSSGSNLCAFEFQVTFHECYPYHDVSGNATRNPHQNNSLQSNLGRMMRRIFLLAACLLAGCSSKVTEPQLKAASLSSSQSDSDHESPLGTNISEPSYWSTQLPFIDLFKYSKPWVSGDATTWDNGNPIATDADGWVTAIAPGQIVRTQMLADFLNPPTGRYVMTWDGTGTFSLSGGCNESPGETTSNRMVLLVTGTILIYFTDTDPSDYIRNIRITQEAHETLSGTWDPWFLDSLSDVSCLRFMDMCRTNQSTLTDWGDRTMVDDARYTSTKGMPYELAVSMANDAMKDAWICVPHLATDSFVTSLADMVRDNLHPSLKCYVEYSNEVWNSQFEQATHCEAMGIAAGIGSSPFQSRLLYYSRRSVEIFNLFTASLGSNDRIIRVLATQAGNPWTAGQVLAFESAYLLCDALAIAPYFGPHITNSNVLQFINMDSDDLLDYVEANSMSVSVSRMHANSGRAAMYGVPMIAYEGGQHIVGNVSSTYRAQITDLINEANRNQRMHGIYRKYLDSWRMSGGQLFVHYNNVSKFSQWGCWGASEWQGQPMSAAPKARALHEFKIDNLRWW